MFFFQAETDHRRKMLSPTQSPAILQRSNSIKKHILSLKGLLKTQKHRLQNPNKKLKYISNTKNLCTSIPKISRILFPTYCSVCQGSMSSTRRMLDYSAL